MEALAGHSPFRTDIYSVADYWGDWERELAAVGFRNGMLYRDFLLDSPYLDRKKSDLYYSLAKEAWKERWSRDIVWDELPPAFNVPQDQRIFRSPHAFANNALTGPEVSGEVNEGSTISPDVKNPYEFARRQFWCGDLAAKEQAFRHHLIQAIDDDECILQMRRFYDPVEKSVSNREVAKCLDGFCEFEQGFSRHEIKSHRGRFVISYDLGNELSLCFGVHEIQKKSYEYPCFRLHDLISLMRYDQIGTAHQTQRDHPWRIQGLPTIWSGYDIRDNSPIAFYIALAFRLRVYRLLCAAFDRFFGNVDRLVFGENRLDY